MTPATSRNAVVVSAAMADAKPMRDLAEAAEAQARATKDLCATTDELRRGVHLQTEALQDTTTLLRKLIRRLEERG